MGVPEKVKLRRATGTSHRLQLNDLPGSERARDVRAKTLTHPTNAAFDKAAWRSAVSAIDEPTERDRRRDFKARLSIAIVRYRPSRYNDQQRGVVGFLQDNRELVHEPNLGLCNIGRNT